MAAGGTNANGRAAGHEPVVVAASAYHGGRMPARDGSQRSAQWLRPQVEQQGLQRYVNTIRERIRLIAAITLLTTAAAVVDVVTAQEEYTAESDILVTPVSQSDTALAGLPLIHQSSDPTRDVETAARLVVNRAVALRVKAQLHLADGPNLIQERLKSEPVAQSNLVAVTATASNANEARDLANGFASGVIAIQTARLHDAIRRTLASLAPRAKTLTPAEAAAPDSAAATAARLQTLATQDDPTLQLQTRAARPGGASWPKTKLSIIAGVIAGLILGIGSAFALQVLDPRLRREEQLRSLYGLPILGRIPKESSRRSQRALAPERLSPSTLESYRTLRATLAASRRGGVTHAPAVLVTSPSPSEGKPTTAIHLASSLALAGNSVILIEADLRRPAIGEALEVNAVHGTGSVLLGMAAFQDALVETKAYGRYLRLLLADKSGAA